MIQAARCRYAGALVKGREGGFGSHRTRWDWVLDFVWILSSTTRASAVFRAAHRQAAQQTAHRNVLQLAFIAADYYVLVVMSNVGSGHGCFTIVLIYTGRSPSRLAIKLRATIRAESTKESSYHLKTCACPSTPSQTSQVRRLQGTTVPHAQRISNTSGSLKLIP